MRSADGTKVVQQADGVVVETGTDGVRRVRRPDGSCIQENPDGTKVVLAVPEAESRDAESDDDVQEVM